MEDISLAGLLTQYSQDAVNRLFTTCVGKVVSNANLSQGSLDVQVIVNKRTADGEVREYPPVLAVPVLFPSSSSAMLSFPINVGDTVLLVFSQRSLDNFKLGASDCHEPSTNRKYSINDAVAIPCIFPFSKSPNSSSNRSLKHGVKDVCLANNIGGPESHIKIDSSGNVEVESPANVSVKAKGNVSVENDGSTSVKTVGAVSVDSGATISLSIGGAPKFDLTASQAIFTVPITAPDFINTVGISFNTHKHPQDPDFGGNKENDTGVPKA